MILDDDNDTTTPRLQRWSLQHPAFGLVEVYIGTTDEMKQIDPGWPKDSSSSAGDKENKEDKAKADTESKAKKSDPPPSHVDEAAATDLLDKATECRRAQAESRKARKTPLSVRLSQKIGINEAILVAVDGEVRVRDNTGFSTYVPIPNSTPAGKLTPTLFRGTGLCLRRTKNFIGEHVSVMVRENTQAPWVALDPPAYTAGQRRAESFESSPIKAAVLPVVEGLGAVGWLLAVMILGPIVGRLFSWLSQFLPDFEIPWPEINIPWPDWHLPTINWPSINIPWPDWKLPEFTPPDWVLWLAEHEDFIKPLVIGLVVGILAVLRVRKSSRVKKQWQASEAGSARASNDDKVSDQPSSTAGEKP